MLIAKSIYERGDKLRQTGDPLDAMLSIHHFHLAIETTFRSIAIEHELAELKKKPINRTDPGFDEWLRIIDNDTKLKEMNLKLPYLNDIRNINIARNQVQHGAQPIASEALLEHKVFAHSFLKEVFGTFFSEEFDAINDLVLISDRCFKDMFEISRDLYLSNIADGRSLSLAILYMIFKIGFDSWIKENDILDIRSLNSAAAKYWSDWEDLEAALMLDWTGINILDYSRFMKSIPIVNIALSGRFEIDSLNNFHDIDINWAESFVKRAILTWQRLGLNPRYPPEYETLDKIRQIAADLLPKTPSRP